VTSLDQGLSSSEARSGKSLGTRLFQTVEECDPGRQFLFDKYVAISRRYDLNKVSLKSYK
jgi:hypothetical protein